MNPLAMIEHSQFLLDGLMKHQGKCGALEEIKNDEAGVIRCSGCGLKLTKQEVPKLEGKGFDIEYY